MEGFRGVHNLKKLPKKQYILTEMKPNFYGTILLRKKPYTPNFSSFEPRAAGNVAGNKYAYQISP